MPRTWGHASAVRTELENSMYTVTFNNMGGQLDSRTAQTPEQAAEAAIAMLQEVGMLYSGDSITIQGEENDE